jgi:hypothetical protein
MTSLQFRQTFVPGIALQFPQPSSIASGSDIGGNGAGILVGGNLGCGMWSASHPSSSELSSMVQVFFRLLGRSRRVFAVPLSAWSACCMSCWLLWIVLSTLFLLCSMISSS